MTAFPIFSRDDPVSLATWLLEEVSRGLLPVWPSTQLFAVRIVAGLTSLHAVRRSEVMNALPTAPESAVVDWDMLLAPLYAMDAVSTPPATDDDLRSAA